MKNVSFVVLLLLSACSSQQVVIVPAAREKPEVSGVDSLHMHIAWALTEESFPADPESAAQLSEQAKELTELADQFLKGQPLSTIRDTVQALESFNAGSDVLSQLSEADSLQALALLETAAVKFEEALMADVFDDESRLWLARVYENLAERFQASVHERLRVLKRLVIWNQDRHDYIALLADAHEDLNTSASALTAAALWERAALIALDDVDMGLREFPDTTFLFAYYVRASRAFVAADRGQLAMNSLDHAKHWQRTDDEKSLIDADSIWLSWDGGNLLARKKFDALMEESHIKPSKSADGFKKLLDDLHTFEARLEVQHQLALVYYTSGMEESAVTLMQQIHAQSPHHQQITEDYAIMTYNLSHKRRQGGDNKGALAYLLQCASLDATVAASAAFEVALLLRNNLEAAIKYAHLAEERRNSLSDQERLTLTQYLAELYRKNGDRDRARVYLDQLKALRTAYK